MSVIVNGPEIFKHGRLITTYFPSAIVVWKSALILRHNICAITIGVSTKVNLQIFNELIEVIFIETTNRQT